MFTIIKFREMFRKKQLYVGSRRLYLTKLYRQLWGNVSIDYIKCWIHILFVKSLNDIVRDIENINSRTIVSLKWNSKG